VELTPFGCNKSIFLIDTRALNFFYLKNVRIDIYFSTDQCDLFSIVVVIARLFERKLFYLFKTFLFDMSLNHYALIYHTTDREKKREITIITKKKKTER